MNESEADERSRAGSFLPKIVSMKKSRRRSKQMERSVIEQQLREHMILSGSTIRIEEEMKHCLEQEYWHSLAERYEWLTVRLLEGLKLRGIVAWHVWQKVCFQNWLVDSTLGVDHFGELSQAYGHVFFMINTKSTQAALDKHRHKARGLYILGFRVQCPLQGASEKEWQEEENRLLEEIIRFFGSGAVQIRM